MLKVSGRITKHLSDGYSPYYVLQESDLSNEGWTTFNLEQLKNQYKEKVCPVCNQLHLMKGKDEILYGYCNT